MNSGPHRYRLKTEEDGYDVSVLILRGSSFFILVTQHCYNEEIAGGGHVARTGETSLLGRPKMR
jgi:hypothetical protein